MLPAENLQGKKILFACVPGDGHFNPLTGLAKHLQSIGCDVLWYTSKEYVPKLEKLNIPYTVFNKALDVPAHKVDEAFPERAKLKGQIKKLNFDMINFFILRSTEYIEDMKHIQQTWQYDVIVADCVFSAIPFIASALHVPVVSIGVLPLIQTSKDLAPSGLGLTPSNSFLGKMKQELLKKLADHVLFKKPNQLFFSLLAERNIPKNAPNAFDALVNSATLFLQSGTPGLEYKRSDLGKNIRFIGPLLPYSAKNENRKKWWDARMDTYKDKILVTQGTVEKDVEKLLVPTLEAYKNTDVLVIVTSGGSQTRELKMRYPYENIIIEDFIVFDDVMPHVQLFITNGGFGGVQLGVQYALPMVVAGVHEGKNEICARIGYFNYGVNLNTEKPKPAQLAKAVDKILSDSSYKQNITRLCEEFKSYDTHSLFTQYLQEVMVG